MGYVGEFYGHQLDRLTGKTTFRSDNSRIVRALSIPLWLFIIPEIIIEMILFLVLLEALAPLVVITRPLANVVYIALLVLVIIGITNQSAGILLPPDLANAVDSASRFVVEDVPRFVKSVNW